MNYHLHFQSPTQPCLLSNRISYHSLPCSLHSSHPGLLAAPKYSRLASVIGPFHCSSHCLECSLLLVSMAHSPKSCKSLLRWYTFNEPKLDCLIQYYSPDHHVLIPQHLSSSNILYTLVTNYIFYLFSDSLYENVGFTGTCYILFSDTF